MKLKPLNVLLLAGALLAFSGCDAFNSGPPPRDFNELIPRMMGAIKNKTPEQAAASLFDVTSPDERRDAIAYLQTKPYGHEPPYMRAYEMLAIDPHPMVRSQAMLALGTSHQAEAVNYLIKGLDDSDPGVRRDAAFGLCTTFGENAIPKLTQHLKDDVEERVRLNCARALWYAATPESEHALIEALDDMDASVVYAAHVSLVKTTGQDFGYDGKSWMNWYQKAYSSAPTGRRADEPALWRIAFDKLSQHLTLYNFVEGHHAGIAL